MDHFCYLCFMSVMLSCLFFAALWSPAGKGLVSRLSRVCDVLLRGQLWFSIVSISDLCLLFVLVLYCYFCHSFVFCMFH